MATLLQQAAKFVSLGRASKAFLTLLHRVRGIISFTREHTNRPARFIAVVNEYKRGRLVKDIEKEFGCSHNTVMRYARMAGLPRRPRGFDPELKAKAIAMYKAKKPLSEIALALGVSQAWVSRVASEAGISRYKKKRLK